MDNSSDFVKDRSKDSDVKTEFRFPCRFYRFNNEYWVKEIGSSVVIGKIKDTPVGVVENNGEISVKFLVENPGLCKLIQHAGNDRTWCFTANEIKEGAVATSIFAVQFQRPSIADEFKKQFEEFRSKIKIKEIA